MRKLFLLGFHLIFIVFVSRARADSYDPFLLNTDRAQPELPTTKIPLITDANTISLCPVEEEEDVDNFKRISEKFPAVTSCLFQRIDKKSKTCAKDAKPLLRKKYDYLTNKMESCGVKNHLVHQFGFYFCGSENTILQLRDKNNQKTPEKFIKLRFFPIYELCIDVEKNEILWTKHTIMTPEIFKEIDDKKLPSEKDPEISTDALSSSFTENFFQQLKDKYFYQFTSIKKKDGVLNRLRKSSKPGSEESETFYKMEETFIVPKEHIAFKMWRKTVNHYINVAPFWDQRSDLMKFVNNGIKNLAHQLHSDHQSSLTIYTKVKTIPDADLSGTDFNESYWVKLLYEENTKSATWIILLNTPEKVKKLAKCGNGADCETIIDWTGVANEPAKYQHSSYVHCCHPSTEEIQKMFNIYLEVPDRYKPAYDLNMDKDVDHQ